MSLPSHPSRTDFLRSRLYRCALAFNKTNDERLKNIRELLEKVDMKQKNHVRRPINKKRYVTSFKIPDCDKSKGRSNKEDRAILAAVDDKVDWVYDAEQDEYYLEIGGFTVMKIPKEMFERLKPFQRDAVKWVADVGPIGGILADDMGMGKTFMSLASLGARMRVKKVRMALVVAPVSVLGGWAEEGNKFLSKFVKNVRIVKVHGKTQQDRLKIIRNAWRSSSFEQPYLIISSWGLVTSARSMKAFMPPSGLSWDYVVLDEAQEIKNHLSTRSKCCRRICHKANTKRLLLTGTPFSNNLNELWSIVNMATAGKILGKIKEFNKEFGKPIREQSFKNTGSYAKKQGDEANEKLQLTLKPYLLRRMKLDFLSEELPPKHEICVWVKPSKQQAMMYKKKIEDNFSLTKNILSSDTDAAKKARLGAFQVLAELRNLMGHPLRLLKGADGDIRSALEQTDLNTIINGSEKLGLALHMLKGFKAGDHKTLLFSQSTQNLDVIQYVLLKQGNLTMARLDGSVSRKCRDEIVACFQKGLFDVLLMSTGAGGTGITLTRADHVIMYDPSWNPSQDAQAVDRAYRIGSTREVRVYRLFVAGGIEEKIYEKQIHKTGLKTTVFTESVGVSRLFDKHELAKVFSRIPDGTCDLLKKFQEEGRAKVLDAHRHKLVSAHNAVIGISDHTSIYGNQKRKAAFADAPANIASKKLKLAEEEGVEEDAVEEVTNESTEDVPMNASIEKTKEIMEDNTNGTGDIQMKPLDNETERTSVAGATELLQEAVDNETTTVPAVVTQELPMITVTD